MSCEQNHLFIIREISSNYRIFMCYSEIVYTTIKLYSFISDSGLLNYNGMLPSTFSNAK